MSAPVFVAGGLALTTMPVVLGAGPFMRSTALVVFLWTPWLGLARGSLFTAVTNLERRPG